MQDSNDKGFALYDMNGVVREDLAVDPDLNEIFADHGEAHFRNGERKVIARLLNNGAQVLATGGGAFIDPETRRQSPDLPLP